jgi:hypothetical protein
MPKHTDSGKTIILKTNSFIGSGKDKTVDHQIENMA